MYSIIASKHLDIQRFCENNSYSDINTYMTNYHNYMYTWTTCNYYVYDFNEIDCRLADLKFDNCNRYAGHPSGSSTYHYYNVNYNSYEDCTWTLTEINDKKPWYNTNYSPNYCENDMFKRHVWEYIFGNYTTYSNTVPS